MSRTVRVHEIARELNDLGIGLARETASNQVCKFLDKNGINPGSCTITSFTQTSKRDGETREILVYHIFY